MDLELLKTFLEVHRVRHFGKAADNLFVTPSAVSARIRLLEEQLGVSLFIRTRNNIQLTPAGERLINHAKAMVNAWEKARYEILSGADAHQGLSILAVPSVWDSRLLPQIASLRKTHPELLLRLETLPSEVIWRRLQQNQADLGFVVEPYVGPDLQIQEMSALELVMVSTEAGQTAESAIKQDYVMVDWGGSFMSRHMALFPDAAVPATWVSTGRMAFELLMNCAGQACYLPTLMVEEALHHRQLYPVEEAPPMRLSIYAAYPAWSNQGDIIEAFLAQQAMPGS